MRCINPAQLTKDSRNLKSVALYTADISSTQISTNARTATPGRQRLHRQQRRQRRVTDGFFLQVKPILSIFHMWKVKTFRDHIDLISETEPSKETVCEI
jgi:hypothetical protein